MLLIFQKNKMIQLEKNWRIEIGRKNVISHRRRSLNKLVEFLEKTSIFHLINFTIGIFGDLL